MPRTVARKCGHTANFRTHRQSYKIKKTIDNPQERWMIFKNTQEAIIDEETFERVQELRRNKRRQLTQSQRRMDEIDRLFKRIYEDMVSGKITESRFDKLSEDYEAEQAKIAKKIEALESEISQQEEDAESIEEFIRRAKKYPVLNELTPTVLNDLVNRVYVCAPDKSSGHRVQEVRISLNLIGFLPESFIAEMLNYQSKERTA